MFDLSQEWQPFFLFCATLARSDNELCDHRIVSRLSCVCVCVSACTFVCLCLASVHWGNQCGATIKYPLLSRPEPAGTEAPFTVVKSQSRTTESLMSTESAGIQRLYSLMHAACSGQKCK